ncbi:UNVERIFIED_CONTAM: Subtilisin-like protease SBT2.4 [Sesamum latifolium]|uniref:Subtilisin-like protease SBT2.4 n=1 Tax=Sesamum latifolium TaxID=2727402 RepID=A0AAW2WNN2_9LAMI
MAGQSQHFLPPNFHISQSKAQTSSHLHANSAMKEEINKLQRNHHGILILLFAFNVITCIAEERGIYLVLLEGEPVAFYQGAAPDKDGRRPVYNSEASMTHAKHLVDSHDQFLQSTLDAGTYDKLYSFKHIVNGFALHTTHSQVKKFKGAPGVKLVEKDRGAKLMTIYTPEFLGLPAVWTQQGGREMQAKGL